MIRLDHTDNRIQIPAESIIPNTTLGNFVMESPLSSLRAVISPSPSYHTSRFQFHHFFSPQPLPSLSHGDASLSQHLVTPTDQHHCQERQRPLALADVDAQIRGLPEWRRWRTLPKVLPSADFGVIMQGAGCLPLSSWLLLQCDTYPIVGDKC
jgi:hypothetical protein